MLSYHIGLNQPIMIIKTMHELVSKQGLSLESIYWSPRHRKIDKGYLCK